MPHKQPLKQTISVFVTLNLILSQILYAVPVGKTTIGIDKQDKLLHNYETDDKSIISDKEKNPNLTIDKTNNDIPLININKPNSKGTSHNIYKAYSVTNKGVILNNSNKITNTALAGQVMPNTNYSKNTKEASLIINEISGSDISKLQGITEIAGSKADIIISNPNGIYINGAGFINANNIRLTTNAPLEKQANKGKIEIDGLGLDLSNTNKSELIASVAKLNAPIYNANELEITLGSKENNDNANSNNDNSKQYSLDASALGSIHANKIKIISNNKGVGVKSNSQIIANTDDLIINSQGNIELKDAYADKNIKLKSDKNIKADNLISNKSIKANSKKDIKINSANANAEIALNSGKDINLNKANSNANINLNANGNVNAKNIIADDISIKTQSDLKANSLQSAKNITLNSDNIKADNLIANKNINLKSNSSIQAGSVVANGKIDISANTNANLNKISSNDNINLITNDTDINSLQSGKSVFINSKNNVVAKDIKANDDIKISSVKTTKLDDVVANGEINVNSNDDIWLDNADSNKKLTLNSGKNINLKSVNSNANINLNAKNDIVANSLQSSKEISLIATNSVNLDKTIISNEKIDISSDFVTNNANLQSKILDINAKNSLINSSEIYAKNINVSGKTLTNFGSLSSQILDLNLNLLTNKGTINANNAKINSDISNTHKILTNELNLNSNAIYNSGEIISDNADIISKDKIINQGVIQSSNLDSANLNNSGKLLIGQNISAVEFINSGEANALNSINSNIIINNENANIQTNNLNSNILDNSGSIYVNSQLNIANELINKENIIATDISADKIYNSKDIKAVNSISSKTILENNGEILAQNSLFSNDIDNKGDIKSNNIQIENNLENSGEILANTIKTDNADNKGSIKSNTINIDKSLDNKGEILANQIDIKNNLHNTNSIKAIGENANINIAVNSFKNSGEILSNKDLKIFTPNFSYGKDDGVINANDNLIINSQTIDISKEWLINSNANFNVADSFINDKEASLLVAKNLNIGSDKFTNFGFIGSGKELSLNSNSIINEKGASIISMADFIANGVDFINKGDITTINSDIKITALNSFTNEAGNIDSANDIVINTDDFKNIGIVSGSYEIKEAKDLIPSLSQIQNEIEAEKKGEIQIDLENILTDLQNQLKDIENSNVRFKELQILNLNNQIKNLQTQISYLQNNTLLNYLSKYNNDDDDDSGMFGSLYWTAWLLQRQAKTKYNELLNAKQKELNANIKFNADEIDPYLKASKIKDWTSGVYVKTAPQIINKYTAIQATINAGNNFILNANKGLNREAIIYAKNDIDILADEFINQREDIEVPISVTFAKNYWYDEWRGGASKWLGKKRRIDATATYTTTINQTLYSDKATRIVAGNNINIQANKFGNGEYAKEKLNNTGKVPTQFNAISNIDNSSLNQGKIDTISLINLPNSNTSMFVINNSDDYLINLNSNVAKLYVNSQIPLNHIVNSDSKNIFPPNPKNLTYKTELDPKYTDLNMFLSSNYLFDRLNFNPDKKIKLLGDSAYETRLLREAIIEKTGKRYLLADNDYEQRKALFDNALDEAKSLNLSLGVALSKEQIQNLSKDIIWYEKEIVANQEVLVPKLYLSKQTLSNLANTNTNSQLNLASINSGANININANEFINTANINSGNDINILSNSFINQTIFTNDKANINANNNIFINSYGDISNLGADIVAKNNLILNSLKNITNQTNLNYFANDYRKTYSTTTNANLNANNILINANNFTNISANINANDNLQIKAKNDINNNYLQSITTTYQGNASNYTKTENKKAILGDIKANNINLIANNDINLAGISLKAKENLNILAGNDINILAAKNSSYKEQGSSKSGFFSSKEEITINQSNTHTNSNLNASNINLASNSDINLFGVDLVANTNNDNLNLNSNINIQAGGDITQASVKDTNYYYHRVTKSSLFGLNQSLHEKEAYNEKALISQALANDGSLTYNAKNNLLLSGVKTYSNKDTNLNADNVFITSLELNSFSNEINKKSKFNLGGFLFETGLKIPLAFSGVILPTDSTEIYKSELHKSNTIKTTNQASNLNSNGNLNINSNNDITIKGSNLNANNNINLSSQSANINIISSQDITQTKTLDEVKRIEIGGANDFIKTLIDDIKNTSIQGHGTVAKIEKSNDDTTKTTITNNSSNLNADNININSNLDTTIKASNLNANDSINIASTGGDINILSDKNLNQSTQNSNLKETIHFVDYKSDNTNLKETNVKSNIVSNNINLNANEITLKASNIIANESIQIDTTRLNLISDKDNHTSISNSNNKDTLIAEVKSNGKIQEIEIPAIIQTGDKFILNGKDISDKLDTKVYQTISNSLNDETIKNSIIKQISSNSNIPLNQEEINQIQVALNSDEWDKSTKRL